MPNSKLKTLAIVILLAANLLLAALLIPRQTARRQEQEALRQSLSRLCAEQEITLDPQSIPDDVTLFALELAESSEEALQAAVALLGKDAAAQSQSNRYLRTYLSDTGQCSISRSGAFSARLTDAKAVSDVSADAEQLLRRMGFSVSSLSDPVELRGNTVQLTAVQAVLDVPLFGSGLTAAYTDGRLTALEGVFYTGTGSLTRVSEAACCSAADALVAFLSQRYALGWVGSSITAMTQGYVRSDTAAAAAVHLTPVWRITTDTASYYVNGITMEITAAD